MNWLESYKRPGGRSKVATTGDSRPVELAKSAVYTLHEYCTNGLPTCYSKDPKVEHQWDCDKFRRGIPQPMLTPGTTAEFESSLYDWWPDLPWDKDGNREAVQWMLQDPDSMAVFEKVKKTFGFDMLKHVIETEVEQDES